MIFTKSHPQLSSSRVRFAAFMYLGLIPVLAYVALISILHVALPHDVAASLVFDPPVLMLVLNTILLFGVSAVVSYIAIRAYLASGSANILLLGCGVLALGGAALAGGWVRPLGGAANTSVTIHNLGVLFGAILHAMSALQTVFKAEPEQMLERRRHKALFGFTGTLFLIVLIIAATVSGIIPPFWKAGVGSTPLKQGVLGTVIALFSLTSIYTMVLYFQTRSRFLYWYSLALALTSTGLIGITVMKAVGDPIGWAGRTAQYVGGIYFLVAALSALREAKEQGFTLGMAIDRFYRRSEVHYRDLIETVSDAIILVDEEGRILLWNQGADRMLGYTSEEAVGCLASELLMPESRRGMLDDVFYTLQNETVTSFASKALEIEIRRKDGTLFRSEVSLSARRLGSGWTKTLVVRDITERMRAEEALRESEGLYRSLFENMLEGFAHCKMIFDDQGHPADFIYLRVNEAFERLTGLKDVMGKRVTEVITQIRDANPELLEIYGRVATTGEPERFVIEFKPLAIWLSISVYSTGKGYFTAVFDNITKRKQADTERELLLAEVRSEKEKLSSLLASIQDEVWFADTEKRFTIANPMARRQFALHSDEVIDVEKLVASLQVLRSDGSPRPSEETPPLRALRGEIVTNQEEIIRTPVTGELRYRQVSSAPVRDEGGNIIGSVSVVRDITERKQMEEELRKSRDDLELRVKERTVELKNANIKLKRSNRRLEELNKELQDFAFVASHDLQEPLRKIRSFGDMLTGKCEDSPDETSRDYIRRMQTAAARMQNLLNSLLSYSRVTTKADPITDTDLKKSVKEALSNLEIMIKEKNARVEVGDMPTVQADRIQMVQLLQNLIQNAMKFHHDGEPPYVRVYSRLREDKRSYEICVEDKGIGFEEKYLDKIFLPFQRLHGRSSEYAGVGMGLAICKKIVERHGGEITAKSELGKGSTFIVTLPVNK
jgi:PAS domain S-box-containing protein